MQLNDIAGSRPDSLSTLSAQAFAELRRAILNGTLAPGARLDIKALAAHLAMSAMPVRDAIRQLEALGFVEHRPHRGARVTELSVDDLRDVYSVRFALEAQAVVLASARFTEADAELAADSLARTAAAEHEVAYDASWQADTAFHFSLYSAAQSPWLIRAIRPLWETSERYRRLSMSPTRDFRERHSEHMSILEACVARDGIVAAQRLGTHLARSANRLARALGDDDLFSEEERVAVPVPRLL